MPAAKIPDECATGFSAGGIIPAPCAPSTPLPQDPLPAELPSDPLPLFAQWFEAAQARRAQPNPDAMVLATATVDGRPSARVVLLKRLVVEPGYVVFYTNYDSRKGRELEANPRAAAVVHWDTLGRQVRLEGVVSVSPPEESDAYFGVPSARQPYWRLGEPAEPAPRRARNPARAGRGRVGATRHGRAAPAALGRIPIVAGGGRALD